jgi:capsular polysaccharide biosynthesis protein
VTATEALRVLRERWWVLASAGLLAAFAAYAYAKFLPGTEPRWRSSVSMQATGRLDYGNFLALEKELRPLAEQVRQLSIMREVDRNLHTDLAPELLLERTRAEPVQDSGQIRLDVDDSDPRRAEQLAIEIANVYTSQHNAAEQGKLREERVILSTLERPMQAVLIWPQTRILVPVAAVLGVLVAGSVLLVQLYFDASVRSAADVQQHVGLPLLAVVPRQRVRTARLGPPRPTVAGAEPAAASAEHPRQVVLSGRQEG